MKVPFGVGAVFLFSSIFQRHLFTRRKDHGENEEMENAAGFILFCGGAVFAA